MSAAENVVAGLFSSPHYPPPQIEKISENAESVFNGMKKKMHGEASEQQSEKNVKRFQIIVN